MTEPGALAANAEGLLDVGRADRAQALALQGLQASPRDPLLLNILIRTQLALGQTHAALSTAEDLLAAEPNDHRSHLMYAISVVERWPLNAKVTREKAVPAAREAVRLAPSSAEAHHVLAVCLANSSMVWVWMVMIRFYNRSVFNEARKSAQRALQFAPKWVSPILLLAAIERQIGDRQKAAQYAEQALRLDPTDSQTLLSAISTTRFGRRRVLATRLAVLHPSHVASDLVFRTHRPMPASVGLIGVSFATMSLLFLGDMITFGELRRGPSHLWVLGPITGIWIAVFLQSWRRRSLRFFDPEVRAVVFHREHRARWSRRLGLGWLIVVPAMWAPASLIGESPTVWATAWVAAGLFMGLLARPRFGLGPEN